MLNLVRYEPRHVNDAPGYARGLVTDTSVPVPTVSECKAAIRTLCDRNLARVIDLDSQREIRRFVSSLNCIGPTDGIPLIGQFDYTIDGASLCRDVLNFANSDFGDDYYWHNYVCFIRRRSLTIVYTFDSEWADDSITSCELVPVSDWEPIGIWRSQWWHEIPSGYRRECLPDLD
ncbi:hypothetical protein Poly59_30150 [Rubripirellula reticaptiva]|uniref:Uncharacterized protein n=2 Tax=Rubripirellula reticaptiva TaxID=2528013 RepID=A0A5C6ENU4_9BACT|nr:hypothetical protein Poly59_30150 [Rubripirellula reticaptiva]